MITVSLQMAYAYASIDITNEYNGVLFTLYRLVHEDNLWSSGYEL